MYTYVQAIADIVHQRTKLEVLCVQNLQVPRAIEINLHIVRIQRLITLHREVRLKK